MNLASVWTRGLAALGLALLLAAPAMSGTVIDNGDGTVTVVQDSGYWELRDAEGNVLDAGGGSPEPREEGGVEPGYEDLTVQPGGGSEGPVEQCTRVESLCQPASFQRKGSKFFYLYHCPGVCGEEAFHRVGEVIDDAWNRVSYRFGSLYDTRKVSGYIYTTSEHYSDQSGGMPWSGGYFNPANNQIHVPAPLGRRGWSLKSLMVHELTHYMLQKRTHSERLGRGAIGYFKFLNEGLAQRQEEALFDDEPPEGGEISQRRQSLWVLKRGFDAGWEFAPLHTMMTNIQMDVGLFYAQSWALVAYIEDSYGTRAIDAMIEHMKGERREMLVFTELNAVHPSRLNILADALKAGGLPEAEQLRAQAQSWAQAAVYREFR